MKNKEQLTKAYDTKILGVRNYSSVQGEFFVKDFLDLEILADFLDEVITGESDITAAGKAFLEEYYGFDYLAEQLAHKLEEAHPNAWSANETLEWLKEVEPMETIRFIEKARRNIDENSTLHEDLLPPDR